MTKITMLSLPIEILFQILRYSSVADILAFEQVNLKAYAICSLWWERLRTLELVSAVKQNDKITSLSADKLVYFLKYKAPKTQELSFEKAPVYLTMGFLIRISDSCPNLISLNLTQSPSHFASADPLYVLALPYFKNLETLKLEMDLPAFSARRGGSYRNIHLPFNQLSPKLQNFYFIGTGVSIANMLQTLREQGYKLSNLKHLELTIRLCIPNLIEELAWFLDFHPNLESVRVENLMFATMQQVLMFLRVIKRSPSLQSIKMDSAACCDLIDTKIVDRIYDQIKAEGISIQGSIFSLRFDPNNND